MQLTDSYLDVIPASIVERYEWAEVRNAASIMQATAGEEFTDLLEVLDGYRLTNWQILFPGGNEGLVAKKLNTAFRERGWREARVDTREESTLVIFPFAAAGERAMRRQVTEVEFEGYKTDNFRARVALDVEWNAKDGNLDRDVASFRALYQTGFIDAAVLITRHYESTTRVSIDLETALFELSVEEASEQIGYPVDRIELLRSRLSADKIGSRLSTTTTTNIEKLTHRLQRGDTGGCPVLAIGISEATMAGGLGHDVA